MAYGFFTTRPFEFNIKCIIVSGVLMAGYWFLPNKNPWMLPAIFIISYVALSWYDVLYNCNSKMYSGQYGISAIFKPFMNTAPAEAEATAEAEAEAEALGRSQYLDKNQKSVYKQKVYLFHLLGVAPILLYMGIKKNTSHEHMYPVMLFLGVMALMYHGMRVFNPRPTDNEHKKAKLKYIYLFHIFIVASLFIYVGMNKKNIPEQLYNGLLGLGGLVSLYHGYMFANNKNRDQKPRLKH